MTSLKFLVSLVTNKPHKSLFSNSSYSTITPFFIPTGPTELEILQNIEDVVHHALPVKKMKDAFSDLNTAKNLILNRVTFCQSRINVSRRLNFMYNLFLSLPIDYKIPLISCDNSKQELAKDVSSWQSC